MSIGDLIDRILGSFIGQLVGVVIISVFVLQAVVTDNSIMGFLMPTFAWMLGLAYGKRDAYREMGKSQD